MNQSIVKIADLSNFSNPELENVTIKASVSIKSIRLGNNRHAYYYMDLRDDSGEITAVAYSDNEPCDNQLNIIEENKTYIFANVTLENSNKRYTSIPNESEIVLNNKSVVQLCGNAPKFEWTLTPLNKSFDEDTTQFFNIVGLCTGVTETEIVLGELTRHVTLVDESRTEVILNVWNQETSLFDELDFNLQPVFFVKDARIHKYQGRTSLTTSRYLRLLEPDDLRAAKIRKAIPQVNPSMYPILNADRTVAIFMPKQQDGNSYVTKNRRYVTIADLSDSIADLDNVTVIATVTMKSIRHNSDDGVYFNFDLKDDSGEIGVDAVGDACVKFQHLIEKNRTYSITGFSLVNSESYYTSILHPKVMILSRDNGIKLCGNAPKVEWPMSPLTMVYGKNKKELVHVFGLCTSIGEAVSFDYNLPLRKRRQVILVDLSRRELILEVQDEDAAIFDALDLNTHPVFFVKDANMYTDKMGPILNEITYLELLEADDPRARRVAEALGVAVANSAANSEFQKKRKPKK